MHDSQGARSRSYKVPIRIFIAAVIPFLPALLFEKYTFHLYLIADPNFFFYSGWRWWVDLICFGVGGVASALVVGPQRRKIGTMPPIIASAALIIALNVVPLCDARECYVSSTDGLGQLRDFLLFASVGVVTAASTSTSPAFSRKSISGEKLAGNGDPRINIRNSDLKTYFDNAFEFGVLTLLGYALSFYPIMHIFAGVSVPYPQDYLQWFLAGAPAAISCSLLALDKFDGKKLLFMVFLTGISGVILGIALGVLLPCEACENYGVSIASILIVASLFSLPAVVFASKSLFPREINSRKTGVARPRSTTRAPVAISATVIVVTMILLWSLFFVGSNYQASLVNVFGGTTVSRFSPFEVGGTFVYDAGYLAIPRVATSAVGVNVSFGGTSIDSARFPNDFLAAGVGDQSPNCCKDGLDLFYRADVALFSNGSEYALARAWWACDPNAACGGYSWQQLLHLSAAQLPSRALSHWVQVEMNWTDSGQIVWYYRINYNETSSSPWIAYSSYDPPKIQNHYWDAGLFYVGEGNRPAYYAYFYQFGVSSAYPITDRSWRIYEQCPMLVLNGAWTCAPKAGFINGIHSFWKVLYTAGASYSGMNFSYLGGHEVEFYYSGTSPADGTPIW